LGRIIDSKTEGPLEKKTQSRSERPRLDVVSELQIWGEWQEAKQADGGGSSLNVEAPEIF